jgi:hypothetical protein
VCGICGLVGEPGALESPSEWVRGMCAQLVHRGPDTDGFREFRFGAIGMRRLRITPNSGNVRSRGWICPGSSSVRAGSWPALAAPCSPNEAPLRKCGT